MFGADRTLALSYVPARDRAAVAALWAIDSAMADVVRTSSQPMLGAIRLAWWRERLEELGTGTLPAEPRLRSVAEHLLPRGIAGSELASLEDGWLRLFDEFPWGFDTAKAIAARGRLLFALAGRILDSENESIADLGGLWALVDAARHCSDPESRAVLIAQGRAASQPIAGTRFKSRLRPLSMLGALAARDLSRGEPFEPEGTPRRVAAMLAHRLTGRLVAD